MDVIQTRNSYSEVFELLKYTDRNDLNKIPMNLLKTIKENRNEQDIPKINFNDINNSLSKKARSLYMWLYLTYITDSREEKERINKAIEIIYPVNCGHVGSRFGPFILRTCR